MTLADEEAAIASVCKEIVLEVKTLPSGHIRLHVRQHSRVCAVQTYRPVQGLHNVRDPYGVA